MIKGKYKTKIGRDVEKKLTSEAGVIMMWRRKEPLA